MINAINGHGPSDKMRHQLQPTKTKVVLPAGLTTNKIEHRIFLKMECHMDGEAFKRRQVHGVALISNSVPLLSSFIVNAL